MSSPLLSAEGIHKTYTMGRVRLQVLRGCNLRVAAGEFVAIMGKSGSGKSTLLHILGALDVPQHGEVLFQNMPVFAPPRERWFYATALDVLSSYERRRIAFRRHAFGFVFQFYHLLPELDVLENVLLTRMVGTSLFEWFRKRAAARRDGGKLAGRPCGGHVRDRNRPARGGLSLVPRPAIPGARANRVEAGQDRVLVQVEQARIVTQKAASLDGSRQIVVCATLEGRQEPDPDAERLLHILQAHLAGFARVAQLLPQILGFLPVSAHADLPPVWSGLTTEAEICPDQIRSSINPRRSPSNPARNWPQAATSSRSGGSCTPAFISSIEARIRHSTPHEEQAATSVQVSASCAMTCTSCASYDWPHWLHGTASISC
jgi:ABC-type Fe3+/spermidine/putrescine transport system ATPase subunit